MIDDIDTQTQKRKYQLAVRAGNHDEVARYISRGANPAWKHDISAVASLSLLCTLLLILAMSR